MTPTYTDARKLLDSLIGRSVHEQDTLILQALTTMYKRGQSRPLVIRYKPDDPHRGQIRPMG